MKNKAHKNLLIAGTSLSVAVTLLTIFIFGYEIWFSLPGVAMAVTQVILAFGFSAISLRLKQAVFIKSGNTGVAPLPKWVFIWQGIAVLLFCLSVSVFYLQSKQG
jgi:hypothetical protein